MSRKRSQNWNEQQRTEECGRVRSRLDRSSKKTIQAPSQDIRSKRDTRPGIVAHLQRTIGNRALSRLSNGGEQPTTYRDLDPNGPAEREADRIAKRLTNRMHTGSESATVRQSPSVSRSSTREGADMRIPSGDSSRPDPWKAVRSGGRPLSSTVKQDFEGRFGTDLSDVRIHTDKAADAAAASIGARAYTIGSDIAFASGTYDPKSTAGRSLLAHELTHVLQQRHRATSSVQRSIDTSSRIEHIDTEENPDGWRWVPPSLDGEIEPVEDLYEAFRLLERFFYGLDRVLHSPAAVPEGTKADVQRARDVTREVLEEVWELYRDVSDGSHYEVPIDETTAFRLADTVGPLSDAYRSIDQMREQTRSELDQIRGDNQLENNVRDLQRTLNEVFMAGETGEPMEKVASGLAEAEDLLSSIHTATARARQLDEFLERPLLNLSINIEGYAKISSDLLGNINTIITFGRSIGTLLDSSPVSDTERNIQNFEAMMDIASIGVGSRTSTLHPFGVYWNLYVVPMTEAALEGVRQLNREYREGRRDLAAVDIHSQRDRNPNAPPRIPNELLETESFPGGQFVFDYLWQLVNDHEPTADITVRTFLEEHREVINAGLPGEARLSEEDIRMSEFRTPSILREHGPLIWAMLYGTLPTDL